VHRKLGDGDAELADLTRVIELEPTFQRGLVSRALLYERLGKRDLAIADYDALLARSPDEKFYRDRRAALLAKKGAGAPTPAPPATQAPTRNAAPELDCRVYVAAAGLTVSVPCGK
jgi:tetratricopeptide (TPR) repeat protein